MKQIIIYWNVCSNQVINRYGLTYPLHPQIKTHGMCAWSHYYEANNPAEKDTQWKCNKIKHYIVLKSNTCNRKNYPICGLWGDIIHFVSKMTASILRVRYLFLQYLIGEHSNTWEFRSNNLWRQKHASESGYNEGA